MDMFIKNLTDNCEKGISDKEILRISDISCKSNNNITVNVSNGYREDEVEFLNSRSKESYIIDRNYRKIYLEVLKFFMLFFIFFRIRITRSC